MKIDMERVVDPSFVGDVGIDHSAELLTFTNRVHGEGDGLAEARHALLTAVGAAAVVEAAATIAAFSGLVRVADGTGIALDTGLADFSHDDRERLGIDRFAGSANTGQPADTASSRAVETIAEMFG